MSYGSDYFDLARASVVLRRQNLQRRQAGRPPVAFPTKFELIINLKTAKAIGLEVRRCCSGSPPR